MAKRIYLLPWIGWVLCYLLHWPVFEVGRMDDWHCPKCGVER